jgi:hypothetical protein
VFHVTNPKTMTLEDLISWINHKGYPVTQITYAEWKNLLFESENFESNALYPFWAYVYTIEENQGIMGKYSNCNTELVVKNSNINCPPVDINLLDLYINYFIETGFINKSTQF